MSKQILIGFVLVSSILLAFSACASTTVQSDTNNPPVIQKLPFQKEYPTYTKLTIYSSKEEIGRPTVVEGRGFWTLLFEPTNEPGIASVKLVDAKIDYSPFTIVFDTDRNGRPELLRVEAIELGPRDFDLEASRGTLNLESGEFKLVIKHAITADTVPLLKKLDVETLYFSFTESGLMDLRTGEFKTYTGAIKLPPPFEGMLISGNEGSEDEPPPCCPKIEAFFASPRVLCPAGCLIGTKNSTTFFITVRYYQNGGSCEPAHDKTPGSTKVKLFNDTKGLEVKISNWSYTPTGIYQKSSHSKPITVCVEQTPSNCPPELSISKDSWFDLTAYGCDKPDVERFDVQIFDSGKHFIKLCTDDYDDKKGPAWYMYNVGSEYGEGVVIEEIENTSNRSVDLKRGGDPWFTMAPKEINRTKYYESKPKGQWEIRLPNYKERVDFENDHDPRKHFCVIIRLRCKCGKY